VEGSSAAGNVTTIKGLEPIRVVSMDEAIQERLQQFIREQELSAGDRLPSENRLGRSRVVFAQAGSGLCARLYTKLTAYTLCIHINRLLEKPQFLQIKALAFAN